MMLRQKTITFYQTDMLIFI